MLNQIQPGDIIRVKQPEHKGKHYTALTVFYNLVEIEIGLFVEIALCEKKYRNRYIPIIIST